MSAFRSKRSLAVSVLSLALVLALPAFGQFRYGGRVDRDEFNRLINQAQNHSDRFMSELGDEHGWLRERVGDLQGRLATIENDVNREASYFEIRSDISSAMNVAAGLDRVVRNRNLDFESQRQWQMLRADLNRMARSYNLHRLI